MKNSLPMPSSIMDLSVLLLKSSMVLKTINKEYTPQQSARAAQVMLTTPLWLLDMVVRPEFHTGLWKTHGVLTGETKDTSESGEVWICVVLQYVTHIHEKFKDFSLSQVHSSSEIKNEEFIKIN